MYSLCCLLIVSDALYMCMSVHVSIYTILLHVIPLSISVRMHVLCIISLSDVHCRHIFVPAALLVVYKFFPATFSPFTPTLSHSYLKRCSTYGARTVFPPSQNIRGSYIFL
uniref:Uncharacterized protein n=1 Tax=Oryza brachyantha TaxID=4533 RepID=J3LQW7_ORYBR